jgi:nucleoid-associated protein YgaU
MRKDVKIGMVIGLLLTVAAVAWVSTHPGFTDLKLQAGLEKESIKEKPAYAEENQLDPTTDKPDKTADAIVSQETPTPDKTLPELTEPTLAQHKEPEKSMYTRIHTVQEGETLSGISQIYYGTASGWQKIYVANRKTLSSPDRLWPGMRLAIPD